MLEHFSSTEEHMTEPKSEEELKQKHTLRKDRDAAVLAQLKKRPELVPTAADYAARLPRPTIEALRRAVAGAGWVEYPGAPERSSMPGNCLRISLERLRKKGLLPSQSSFAAPQGKKTVPKKLAAKVVSVKTIGTRHPEGIDRAAIIIEAARTGLKVRLLVDGTIEVQP